MESHPLLEMENITEDEKTVKSGVVLGSSRNISVDDEGASAIPKGTIDPVYEAKARVLNNAVRSYMPKGSLTC